ncbi:MAG TPA: hypothetical protein VFK12_07875 [Gammaproteobacteria bacterium]|nr:hypothetical protein [Gammaproteobacteria bacterium]
MAELNLNATVKALAVVTATVLLQLLGAILLKQATRTVNMGFIFPVVFIAIAFGVQGMRFLLWGYAHRRWPLSVTYPMSAVFFPLLIAVAALYGEKIAVGQWLGGLFITAGVMWLTIQSRE